VLAICLGVCSTCVMASRARVDGRRQCRSCRRLEAEVDGLRCQIEALKTERATLQAKLEDARRAGKRQAAPFSKDQRVPEGKRKRPGRKSGADHGRHSHRLAPKTPSDTVVVPLPPSCPHCGCRDLSVDEVSKQFQDELVAAVVHRQFLIERGRCPDCKRMVRGRHPEQTSEALGAAGAMLGPKAMALAAWLHYACGVSAAKIAHLYGELGLCVSASGITQALLRLADDASGTYDALLQALRASPVVSPDETSWRVDATRGWLWVFVGNKITV
jgi:transposase